MSIQKPTVTKDVQALINNDVKATSRERVRKLLRDTYYAGPIPKGQSPERSMGANTSSPGSNLRRSRDGALWNLTQKQENILLETAIEFDLIGHHNGQYFTTELGRDTLHALDTCDSCGTVKQPHYDERVVKISRYSSGKNHSLITKCSNCDDGPINWSRDEFPPTRTGTDDAERIVRSIEHATLHGVGVGEWTEPEHRALTDFINTVHEEHHSDFDRHLNRYSTPARLPGGHTALKSVYDNYSTDVCRDFSKLLLKTYYGACLSPAEQGIVGHVAAGLPDARDSSGQNHHHAESYTEPLAVIEGDRWEATLRFEATGNYVTITGQAESTQSKIEYETKSGMRISASSTSIGRVIVHPLPDDLNHYDQGDVATVVAFTVLDETTYSATSRVEHAFDATKKGVNLDKRNHQMKLGSIFNKIVKGRPVNSSTFSNGTRHDLNHTERVELARRIEDWADTDNLPPLIERYANRELA